MKDTVILEGKIYISARRAAQISGYATDYIGQLCRYGRLSSRMLGRAWFVEENELKNYSKNNPKKNSKKDLENDTPAEAFSPPQLPVSESRIQQGDGVAGGSVGVDGSQTDSLGELIKKVLSEHNHAIIINQPQPQLLASPPELLLKSPLPKVREEKEFKDEKEVREVKVPLKKLDRPYRRSGLGSAVAIASLVLIIISGIASLSLFYRAPVISQVELMDEYSSPLDSNTAAAGEVESGPVVGTMSAIKYVLYSVYSSIAHSFYRKNSSQEQAEIEPVDTNIAVVPSTKDKDKDAVIKTKLQQSFSDEVKVTSDSYGGSGIIEPVFRKETSDSFIYVSVPIKQKQAEE